MRQLRRTILLQLTAGLGAVMHVAKSFAESPFFVRRSGHRVEPLCHVPNYDYHSNVRSPSFTIRSHPALPLLSPRLVEQTIQQLRLKSVSPTHAVASDGDKLVATSSEVAARANTQGKLFQFATDHVDIAHCRLSDMSMIIESNGAWILSARADQNPYDGKRGPELQLRRNRFHVLVRLLNSSRHAGENLTPLVENQHRFDQAGKQAIEQIVIDPFMVECEAPYYLYRNGISQVVVNTFDLINQLEVEFHVDWDPLIGSGKGVVPPWQIER
jgi:hypothetical protein